MSVLAGLNSRSYKAVANADAGYPNAINATDILRIYHSEVDTEATGEQVTNGAMASDTGWTKGTGWSIGSGVATASAGTGSDLKQTETDIVEGRSYVVVFLLTRSAGSITFHLAGTAGTARSTGATFTETLVAGSGATFQITFTKDSSFAGTVDLVSVTPVDLYVGIIGYGFLKALAYGGDAALDTGCVLLDTSNGDAAPEDYPLADGVETLFGGLHESIVLKSVGTGVRLFFG